jgi:preprotein translocase subunit SecD
MNINTSLDTRTGRKTVTVTADGEAAEQLAQILKMAGMGQAQPEPQAQVVAIGEEFTNKPDVDYKSIDAIIKQGGDLNRKKKQDPKTANKAANPLKEGENEIDERLKSMYSRFSQR